MPPKPTVPGAPPRIERRNFAYPEQYYKAKESANRITKPLQRKLPAWNAPVISKGFKQKHLTTMQNEDDILPVIKRAQSIASKRGISKSTVIGATPDQRSQFEENLRDSKVQKTLKKGQPTSVPLQGTSVTIERINPHTSRTHIKFGEQKLKGEARGKNPTILSHFGNI